MRSLKHRTISGAVLFLLLTGLSVTVQAARPERLIEGWRPVQFVIDLKFDDRLETISSATTTVTVAVLRDGLDQIDLDFGELDIDTVTVGGKPTSFRRIKDRFVVFLSAPARSGSQVEVVIKYHGRPADGLIFSRDRDNQATVVGDNWPDRVHNWIPCLDHPSAKAPVTFTITAPADDLVVANGGLIRNVSNADRTITWTYVEPAPISPYNMIVAVGPFARGEIPALVPLSWYVPRSEAQFATRGFASAAAAVKLFSHAIAPFPYPKLALIVGATKFGGMENAGAIVFSANLFQNYAAAEKPSPAFDAPRDVIDLVAHEVAHQWFGDSVTESTWADLWLSEGFATYYAGLFREWTEGKDSLRDFMDEAARTYFAYEKKQRTPLHDTETMDLMALLNPNNYQKGAWVLHMLRGQLGDGEFFAGLRGFYAGHKGGTATTDDLRRAMEKTSGRDLREFFARWVYGAGHPVYDVTWRWSAGRRGPQGVVTVTVNQTQADAAFLTPLPIEIKSGASAVREKIRPTGKTTVVRFALPGRPEAIRIDPDGMVLKEATVREVRAAAAGR